MQLNKVHSVRTLALVARDLGRDEDWLGDLTLGMEPEDGVVQVCNPTHEDGIMAFTEFGVENLFNLIDIYRSRTE